MSRTLRWIADTLAPTSAVVPPPDSPKPRPVPIIILVCSLVLVAVVVGEIATGSFATIVGLVALATFASVAAWTVGDSSASLEIPSQIGVGGRLAGSAAVGVVVVWVAAWIAEEYQLGAPVAAPSMTVVDFSGLAEPCRERLRLQLHTPSATLLKEAADHSLAAIRFHGDADTLALLEATWLDAGVAHAETIAVHRALHIVPAGLTC